MKLVVGLGNYDDNYIGTRHNVGFDLIDRLVENYTNKSYKEKFKSLYQIVNISGEKIIFQKPLTYMNLSGDAIQEIKQFYKLENKDIIVIYDDMDISLGNYKIKNNGSSAGHNGIKSILNNVGTDFIRLKIGINRPKNDKISYVLGKFTKEEESQLEEVKKIIPKIIEDSLKLTVEQLVSKYNKKNN